MPRAAGAEGERINNNITGTFLCRCTFDPSLEIGLIVLLTCAPIVIAVIPLLFLRAAAGVGTMAMPYALMLCGV